MSSLFQSLKDKAQSAVSSSGLADRIPGGHFGQGQHADGKTSPTSSSPPPANQSSSGLAGFTKSHAFESIQHQLRTFQQQYSSSTTPVQKIITSAKGVALDYDTIARDSQAHSKELYLWGQTETDDIMDVTDRLGWLNYVQGSLASRLASQMNSARSSFKALRDAENALAPRRNIRTGLQNQITRIEYDQRKDQMTRLPDLKAQLQRAEAGDEAAEKEIEVLKRKAIRESAQMQWEAVQEYAEKLTMVAQAALAIVPALPPTPPSKAQPYSGAQTTASVRASLQRALDSYSPGNVQLIFGDVQPSDLKHTRSFGETHAQELSRIGQPDASGSNIPLTPPLSGATAQPPAIPQPSQYSPQFPQPVTSPLSLSRPARIPSPHAVSPSPATATSPLNASPPLNPAVLNQAPAPIPTPPNASAQVAVPNPADPATKVPSITPTVAETGVPLKSAGPDGPGPSSGSLLNKRAVGSPSTSPIASLPPPVIASHYESAEEEKHRLEREERERVLQGEGGLGRVHDPNPKYESAEEEKKRLEREERERVLRQGGGGQGQPPRPDDSQHNDGADREELPPYQEF